MGWDGMGLVAMITAMDIRTLVAGRGLESGVEIGVG